MLSEQVLVQLKPYLGARVADATLRLQCQSLGLQPTDLSPADLSPLVSRLQLTLQMFLGSRKAGLIAQSLLALAALEGVEA